MPRIILAAVLITLSIQPAIAQKSDVHREHVRSASKIANLPENAFGERYDYYKGELSFYQEDVRLAGIGPDIVIGRTLSVGEVPGLKGAGEWQLTIPRLMTKSTSLPLWGHGGNVNGYLYTRCSSFPGGPPSSSNTVPSRDWWNGVQLIDANGRSREVLQRSPLNASAPQDNAPAYPALTGDNWQFSCLQSTANGAQGEAFLATAPDGTRYWFDRLIQGKRVDHATHMGPDGTERGVLIYRAAALVTRVEDSDGNYLTYQYSGDELQSITGSDGRLVSLSWNPTGALSSVSVGTRTWSYGYTDGHLSQVTLPDGSFQAFDMAQISSAMTVGVSVSCDANVGLATIVDGWPSGSPQIAGSMISASGLKANYILGERLHARAKVPLFCTPASMNQPQDYAVISPYFVSFSLLSRRYVGPGVDQQWLYDYSFATPSWNTCTTCTGTTTTEVTKPDGSKDRYSHSAEWGAYEGKLLQLDEGIRLGSASRTTVYEYAQNEGMPYPAELGRINSMQGKANTLPSTTHAPLKSKSIIQEGVVHTYVVNEFDAYARPVSVTESSEQLP